MTKGCKQYIGAFKNVEELNLYETTFKSFNKILTYKIIFIC